jgi:hypothetical protein
LVPYQELWACARGQWECAVKQEYNALGEFDKWVGQSHLDFAADRSLENYGKQTEQPHNESSL